MISTSLLARLTKLKGQVNNVIAGKTAQVEDSLACLLAGGTC
jgi:hypothetical protein